MLLKLAYLQQTKWLILNLPHYRTARTISVSNIVEDYRVMLIPQPSVAEAPIESGSVASKPTRKIASHT